MMVSCAGDGLVRIWDAGTGQCLKTLVDEDRRAVTSVRFTPNGRFVLAWTLDGCVRLWDYVGGSCVKTYQGHINERYGLGGCIGGYGDASGGAFIVSGSEDGTLVAWDAVSKEVLWRGEGHRKVVLGVDFWRGKDGRGLLVSGGIDKDIRLWVEQNNDSIDESMANGNGHLSDQHAGGLVDGLVTSMDAETSDMEEA